MKHSWFPLVAILSLTFQVPTLVASETPQDQTNVDPTSLGLKLLVAHKDPKTGFVVGGKNPTSLIRILAEINGRPIDGLQRDMRPGADSEVGSDSGFLGADEDLREVLTSDNQFVVDEQGLTHQKLAHELRILAALGAKNPDREFLYHGQRFTVTVRYFRGYQLSPFRDGTRSNAEATVRNLTNGKTITYSLLVPDMIERYGFYEGKGTPYRVEPLRVIDVLDFLGK